MFQCRRFMESEVELNAMINEMHVIATVPELYNIVVDLNAVQSLLQLLGHENTGRLSIRKKMYNTLYCELTSILFSHS